MVDTPGYTPLPFRTGPFDGGMVGRTIELGTPDLLTPRDIYERLDRYVIGQDRAKRAIAIAAYNHMKRLALKGVGGPSLVRKSNVLLIGPTGSGKTHLARNLAQILEVPFTVVDATEYTEAGYYGKDVEVMIADLLLRAGHDVAKAQKGIIFIDEVDKIARRSHGAKTGSGGRDIGGEGVQQAMLKLLEGREIFVPLQVTQHWARHDFVPIDTSDILFICAGTFSDLQGQGEARAVGFGSGTPGSRNRRKIGQKELIDYGMLSEFLGRLPVVVQLDELAPDELRRILTEPPDAIVREYEELLSADGIHLEFSEGALQEMVAWAVEKGLGARALRGVVEEVMADWMFEAPERRGETIAIDAAWVAGKLTGISGPSLAP